MNAAMNVLALCADPGVPLDGNKGASVHLRAVWNALAAAGCRVHGVAPSRGGAPVFHPGVSIHPIVADRGEFSSEIARIARDLPADVLLERLALGATAGLTIARDRHLPRVVEVNAPLDDEATRFRVEPGAAAIEAMSASLREADATYVVSSALVAWAQRHGARQVRVIPNGVDVAAFAGVRRSRGAGPGRATAN